MTRLPIQGRSLAAALLVAPVLAGCWGDLVEDQTIGSPAAPSGGAIFSTYVAVGTSLGAGFQSGGLNDSTQKQGYAYLLARQMGLTPGVNWLYPALQMPGCPPPLTNVTAGTRVTPTGFPVSTSSSCYLRTTASAARPALHNVSVPGIRTRQVLFAADATFPVTDSIKLAQFLVGYANPIDLMEAARPTFVTLEMGANDVLGGASRGDTTLFTPLADFQADYTSIANRIQATGASVAVMNLPTSTAALPHFTAAQVFFVLKNVTPTAPFNLATFDLDASCNPPAAGGVGDSVLVPFASTGAIAAVLSTGGSIRMNCALDSIAVVTAGASGQAPGLRAILTRDETRVLARRLIDMNAHITAEATARGWAIADWSTALRTAAATGLIPSFPNLAAPSSTIFGPLFSLDGIHPNLAGHKIMAQAFIDAINTRYGTTLRAP